MSAPVSVVLPALDTRALLERNLPPLLAELAARGMGDEVVVVDDTGDDVLAPWLAAAFPSVRVVARPENGGFARAVHAGVEASRHGLVLSLNTDVRVQPGFLDPLVAALASDDVLAVSPRVLLNGDAELVESRTRVALRDGLLALERSDVDGAEATAEPEGLHDVPFVVGGTMLFRRDEFLARGGFDPLFEPFYLEDLDLCWEGWARGRRIVVEPASLVHHEHRGTIGARVAPGVVRAAIERNRLLFLWKHLDTPALLEEHLTALARRATDAWLTEDREALVWLALALERRDEALAARADRGAVRADFATLLARLGGTCAPAE